ncbi:Urease accessory protein UreF, partial [Folsomia candida]
KELDNGCPSAEGQIGESSQVQVIQLEADPRIESLLTEFRKFQEESLRNQHLLLERVANLEKLVIKSTRIAAANYPITNINWPAKTLYELEEIEALLKNPLTYNQEISLLSKNNGNGLAPDVYAMLHSMITNDLRSKIRFTDKSKKIPFENRLSAKLVRDAIKSGDSYTTVKDSQINHQMGCWFRMKIKTKINNADITPNTETSSRESTSASTETDTDSIPAATSSQAQ